MGMGFAIIAPESQATRIKSLSDGAKQVGSISKRGIHVQYDSGQIEIAK
jgi:phosphoribosylaminoimidazole (AIR) synthetase